MKGQTIEVLETRLQYDRGARYTKFATVEVLERGRKHRQRCPSLRPKVATNKGKQRKHTIFCSWCSPEFLVTWYG